MADDSDQRANFQALLHQRDSLMQALRSLLDAMPATDAKARREARVLLATLKITLQRAFSRARVRAGLPHIRIHDLRHSTGSALVNAGVPLRVIAELLGHRDQRSTRRYTHLTPETLADAVAQVGRKVPHKRPRAA